MAKKNKKMQAEETVELPVETQESAPVEPQPDEMKLLSLTQVEVLSLKLYESEVRANSYAAVIRQMERDAYLKRIDPEGKLAKFDEEIRGFANKANGARNSYQSTITSIESRVGISMKDYTYDDETGALRYIAG